MIAVRVDDNEAEGLDTSDGRWSVVCVKHGSLLSADTRTQARDDARLARAAGWCEWCWDCCAMEAT